MDARPPTPGQAPRDPKHRPDPVAVAAIYVTLVALAMGGIWAGIELRRWVWDKTHDARFKGDIRNAFRQGKRAQDLGYLNVYDTLVEKHGVGGRYGCDYAPLRLGIATTWVGWLERQEPGITKWRNEHALTWPLLRLNLAMELTAAVLMFFVVRLWVRRQGDGEGRPSEIRAAALGAAAAGLLWFNPALIIDAHAWPQWDAWALPFFLGATLAVSLRRYGIAGLLIAVCAMLKGQILLVCPVFLLIALFRRDWRGLVNGPIGFALGTALIASPWLLRDGTALKLALLIAVFGAVLLWSINRTGWRSPWLHSAAGAVAIFGVALTAWVFEGSLAWYHVGWSGPTEQYLRMHMGTTANLAALLRDGWGWRVMDPVAATWLPFELPLRTAMIIAYGATLVWCGWFAARAADARRKVFLLAVVSPWVLMFALMPQMHERYLVWGAATSAAFVALGAGPMLVHGFVTAVASLQVLIPLMQSDQELLPAVRLFADGAVPGVGWGLLVVCGALLVMMCRRSPSRARAISP